MNLETGSFTIDLLHLLLIAAVIFLAITVVRINAAAKVNTSKTVQPEQAPSEPKEEKPSTPVIEAVNTDSAMQLLSLLQQEARFVDFTQEDLTGFSDAEIGAVARVVHEGSKKALGQYFTLVPVARELEESAVAVPVGFNPAHYRLTGNVVGEAPFNGTLIHRGWQVTKSELPKIAKGHDTSILAPAEVEL